MNGTYLNRSQVTAAGLPALKYVEKFGKILGKSKINTKSVKTAKPARNLLFSTSLVAADIEKFGPGLIV